MRTCVLGFTAVVLIATACAKRERFERPVKLGGKTVSPEVLNEGRDVYMHYCYACHGESGDGRGPSAPTMRPPPRDFTTGLFKFAGVTAGGLPHDSDLIALIREGLAGTPMLPWDLSQRQRFAVVQYIKTFSQRWLDEEPGVRILPDGEDPWVNKPEDAITRGEALYHLVGAVMNEQTGEPDALFPGCTTCHPNYLDTNDLKALAKKFPGTTPPPRDNATRPMLKESMYRVGELPMQILPPDFEFHTLKNGQNTKTLFRTIAAGVGGTAMIAWKGTVKDPDIWALAHYVRHVIRDASDGQNAATGTSQRPSR